jgi:hypothetical protein
MVKLNKVGFIFFAVVLTAILLVNDPNISTIKDVTPLKIIVAIVFAILGTFLFKFIFDKGAAWMYRKYGTKEPQS